MTCTGSNSPRASATSSAATVSASSFQADELLPRSVVLVAPTSRSARPASFRPEIEAEGETTRVLVEQVGAVDVQRLGELAGQLTREELWGVDDALVTVLGLR